MFPPIGIGAYTKRFLEKQPSIVVAPKGAQPQYTEGNRARADDFLGLLVQIINGAPSSGDDMQSLIRWAGSSAIILTDGVTGRWVTTAGKS